MRGLDTPALLVLLTGGPGAHRLAEGALGNELVTTAANIFELEVLARQRPGGRSARLAALDRLRHRLTILPLDAEGARRAAQLVSEARGAAVQRDALILAAFEQHGVLEMATSDPARFGPLRSRVKVVGIDKRAPKERK